MLAAQARPAHTDPLTGTSVLRCDPGRDIATADTLHGPVTATRMPTGPMTFDGEDMNGSTPKLHVKAHDGTKWTVKLGVEARPGTAADHLLWAMGYCVPDDVFLPELKVLNLPAHLKRDQAFVGAGGMVYDVRLKRVPGGKRVARWRWTRNPFVGTRELNGLRVLMAVTSNWDLKTINNSVYRMHGNDSRLEYMVTDLGSSFGMDSQAISEDKSKGNPNSYDHGRFIRTVSGGRISFAEPGMPPFIMQLYFWKELPQRITMRGVTRNIPVTDAAWMAAKLAELSRAQIADLFRGAGYGPGEVDEYTHALRGRIAALQAATADAAAVAPATSH